MNKLLIVFLVLLGIACNNSKRKLPFLGQSTINAKGDTVYHAIRKFEFINQDGETVTNETFKNKIYVADFFFTSCPTICPVMKTQMLRVFEKYKNKPNFGILSTTIDPGHDSVNVLKKYKSKLGILGKQWQFVTGPQQDIYEIAQKDYMVSAIEDKKAVDEGGFVHSGAFVLIDQNRHVRGVYDGTKEQEVNRLMKDIDILLEK